MPQININNYSFKYFEYGSGEPLVLIHGSASDYRTWQIQQEIFSKHYRTLGYSRRYHWPNKRIADGADYSLTQHVNDLEAFLRLLYSTPAHLVGHSYGAFVCLLLTIKSPEMVRSLVLAEPPVITLFVSNTPKPSEILKLLVTRPRTATAIIKFGATGIGPAISALKKDNIEKALSIFGRATLGAGVYHSLSDTRREQAWVNMIKAELLGSGYPPLDDNELRNIQIPTLLMCAERSPGLFHRFTDRLQELLPQVERKEIPGASHIMHEDNPSAYNEAVLSFLKR